MEKLMMVVGLMLVMAYGATTNHATTRVTHQPHTVTSDCMWEYTPESGWTCDIVR